MLGALDAHKNAVSFVGTALLCDAGFSLPVWRR